MKPSNLHAKGWLECLSRPEGSSPLGEITADTINRWRSLQRSEPVSETEDQELNEDRCFGFYHFEGESSPRCWDLVNAEELEPTILPEHLNTTGVALANVVLFLTEYSQSYFYQGGSPQATVPNLAVETLAAGLFDMAEYLYQINTHAQVGQRLYMESLNAPAGGREELELTRAAAALHTNHLNKAHLGILGLVSDLATIDKTLQQLIAQTELDCREGIRSATLVREFIELPEPIRSAYVTNGSVLTSHGVRTAEFIAHWVGNCKQGHVTDVDGADLLIARAREARICVSQFRRVIEDRLREYQNHTLVYDSEIFTRENWERLGSMYSALQEQVSPNGFPTFAEGLHPVAGGLEYPTT